MWYLYIFNGPYAYYPQKGTFHIGGKKKGVSLCGIEYKYFCDSTVKINEEDTCCEKCAKKEFIRQLKEGSKGR
jgi:hypothetical protein